MALPFLGVTSQVPEEDNALNDEQSGESIGLSCTKVSGARARCPFLKAPGEFSVLRGILQTCSILK